MHAKILQSLRLSILTFIFFLSTLFLSPTTYAAVVAKVRGKNVIINKQSTRMKVGQLFYLYNKRGRKSGIVRIKSVKGKTVKGRLLRKSSAKKGYTLKLRKKKKRRRYARKKKHRPKKSKYGNMGIGALVGFSTATMNVRTTDGGGNDEDITLTGGAPNFKALLDYAIFDHFWFRGMVGIEPLALVGPTSDGCFPLDTNSKCKVTINYISFDFWGRWVMTTGAFRPWIGAGFNMLVPMSKSATAIDEESIINNSVFAGGLGFDWYITKGLYIPLQIEYGAYPATEKVKASYAGGRLGLGWSF